MNRGTPELNIIVVPDSGTGELSGLSGKMHIIIADGKHSFEFDYGLPGEKDVGSDSQPLTVRPGELYPVIRTAPSKIITLDTSIKQVKDNVQVITDLLQSLLDKQTVVVVKAAWFGRGLLSTLIDRFLFILVRMRVRVARTLLGGRNNRSFAHDLLPSKSRTLSSEYHNRV
jgi:hypothetical protein